MFQFGLAKKLKRIKLIVTDVDGVLTDGLIRFLGADEEMKVFYAKDSAPMRLALAQGIQILFITGRQSAAVERRAKQYDIRFLYKTTLKDRAFPDVIKEWYRVSRDEVLYIGDDLNDLPQFPHAGVTVAPRDGAAEVRRAATMVTRAKGGQGVMAEVIERVMRAQGTWEKAVAQVAEASSTKPN